MIAVSCPKVRSDLTFGHERAIMVGAARWERYPSLRWAVVGPARRGLTWAFRACNGLRAVGWFLHWLL